VSGPVLRARPGWFVPPSLSARSSDLRTELQVLVGQPAPEGDLGSRLGRLVDEQVDSLKVAFADLDAGPHERRDLRPDRAAVLRTFSFVQKGAARDGAAAAWEEDGVAVVALVTCEHGALSSTDVDELLADVESSQWRAGVVLTGVEIHAAAGIAGVDPPPLEHGRFTDDSDHEMREALLDAARSSLWARGLLSTSAPSSGGSDAARLSLDPALADLLTVIAAARTAVFLTVTSSGRSQTSLVAGSDDSFVVVGPSGLGTYRLSRASRADAWTALRRMTGLDSTSDGRPGQPPDGARTTTDALRAATNGTGSDDVVGVRRLVGVRALRRSPSGPEFSDLGWADGGDLGAWRVDATEAPTLVLAAAATAELEQELRDVLQPAAETV